MAFQVQAVHKTLRVKKMIVNYSEFLILMHPIVSTKYNNYKYSFLPFERTQVTHKTHQSVFVSASALADISDEEFTSPCQYNFHFFHSLSMF